VCRVSRLSANTAQCNVLYIATNNGSGGFDGRFIGGSETYRYSHLPRQCDPGAMRELLIEQSSLLPKAFRFRAAIHVHQVTWCRIQEPHTRAVHQQRQRTLLQHSQLFMMRWSCSAGSFFVAPDEAADCPDLHLVDLTAKGVDGRSLLKKKQTRLACRA
jgi:hypothetical protein